MKKRNNQAGFTLIELLVVIAIIGILTGALLVAINPQSMVRKGRDARRLEDLDKLTEAINLALADGEILLADTSGCINCNSYEGTRTVDGTGYVRFTIPTGKVGLSEFIPVLPQDPINEPITINSVTTNYWYTYASNGTDFEINAVLESTDYAPKMADDGGEDNTVYEIGTILSLL